jgi:serine/threonine-protein kinase RsbW
MAGPQIQESVTPAGRAERARVARAFAVGVLGPGHPCGDDAALLASELFGNSVRHSRSGAAGGTVTVAVSAGDGLVRVEVTDRSGPRVPSCPLLAGMRKAAEGFSSLQAWRRGGGGGSVAGGR